MISQSKISLVTSLQHKKYRKEQQLFLIEGEKLVEEAMRRNCEIDFIVAQTDWSDNAKHIAHQYNGDVFTADDKTFKKISSLISPSPLLAVLKIPQDQSIVMKGVIPVLDDIRDPGNLGTIIRTAEWFGFKQIICSNSSVDCYNPKVVQASMGSLLSVNVHYVDIADMIDSNSNMEVYAATADAQKSIEEIDLSRDAFMIMGNESNGVSTEVLNRSKEKYKIRGGDTETESLNVAIATGIILYHISNH